LISAAAEEILVVSALFVAAGTIDSTTKIVLRPRAWQVCRVTIF
jgi:hypothetical protein